MIIFTETGYFNIASFCYSYQYRIERTVSILKQKRIMTIQDLSCFGKCSLTVAHPIMSAMGLEVCPIPTAVLSTHTGGFTGWTFRDLSADLPAIAAHWKSQGLTFDGISTGYLGSAEMIGMVADYFRLFPEAVKIVDPVFADNGKLYTGFSQEYAAGMAELCGKADVIVPNLTEASFMLGEEYVPSGYDEEYIHGVLRRLAALGCRVAVVTGVVYDRTQQGAVAFDSDSGQFFQYFRENIDVSFHGTGDVFTSALAGAVTLGRSMTDALKIAVDYTVESIKATMPDKAEHWYGVKFETCLPGLIKALGE